jgi:hypothetical protein
MGRFIGKRVELIIQPLEDDRDKTIQASLCSLGGAYGADEPEYAMADVKERNPAYGGR